NSDRVDHERQIKSAEARGDYEEAQIIKETFAQWEKKEGQQEEKLVCPVCGDPLLVPTAKGTSRPHTPHNWALPPWDRVRQLRKDIETLHAELDRVLESLEPSSE